MGVAFALENPASPFIEKPIASGPSPPLWPVGKRFAGLPGLKQSAISHPKAIRQAHRSMHPYA
jgi:hypothetical protein